MSRNQPISKMEEVLIWLYFFIVVCMLFAYFDICEPIWIILFLLEGLYLGSGSIYIWKQ